MNEWEPKLLAPPSSATPLRERIELLFAEQRTAWPMLRNGEAALDKILTKRLFIDGHAIVVQANPGRSISTNAKVDPASIAARPCFLCPGSLPHEERGIAFDKFIVLPNPYPILKRHVTIAFHRHEQQHLQGHVGDMLALSEALGPDMFVLYNGPRCGASAPDHLHFQACSSAGVPLFEQFPSTDDDGSAVPLTIGCRNLIVCSSSIKSQVISSILAIMPGIGRITGEPDEPMLNMIAIYRNGEYSVALFLREKHRSACFFAEPELQLSISPAAIEMAGIVVVADSNHFERVNEAAVRAMYNEVTIRDDLFYRIAEEVCS